MTMAGGFEECESRSDGVPGMQLARERGDEDRNDLVADELVDDAFVVDHDSRGRRVETVELAAKLGRADLLGKGCRAAHVREQEARLDLRAAVHRREQVEALAAITRVLGPTVTTHEVHEKV